jgi:hypothetical protein
MYPSGYEKSREIFMSAWLVAATGIAYALVAVDQYLKGQPDLAGMWAGYAFSQIFLWRMAA